MPDPVTQGAAGELPQAVVVFLFGSFGLLVGSFLNVAIHRLPREGMGVSNPKRSQCPSCGRGLTWKENIPLFSWIVQRGRCVGCGWSIPFRYPLVEALTAVLWALAAWMAPSLPLAFVFILVLSGLVVATFVDFDFMEIPDEVSIGGMVVAPLISALLPSLHRDTWLARELSSGPEVDRVGAFLASLAGLVVGGGVLIAIGELGKRLFKRDAMGFGDVKLLAAGGGFIGPGGALLALFLGTLVASVAGLGNILRYHCFLRRRARERGVPKPFGRTLAAARICGRYLPFGPYLGIGIGIVLLDWKDVLGLLQEFALAG